MKLAQSFGFQFFNHETQTQKTFKLLQNVDTLEESFMNFKIYHFYKLLNQTLIFGNETST